MRKPKPIPAAQARPGRQSPAETHPAPGSGIVDLYLHDAQLSATQGHTASELIEGIRQGLPVSELNALQTVLDMPIERLAPKLGISRATLNRRLAKGRLEPLESDRLVRFARLMGKATEVLETKENARRWLGSPQVGLGGAVPLDYAETEVGAREVEDLLGRIEYGVYS
jgi:putative toxin-antitoxin system antitoxin component (TIGR02293 family)